MRLFFADNKSLTEDPGAVKINGDEIRGAYEDAGTVSYCGKSRRSHFELTSEKTKREATLHKNPRNDLLAVLARRRSLRHAAN